MKPAVLPLRACGPARAVGTGQLGPDTQGPGSQLCWSTPESGVGLPAADGGFHRVTGGGALVARAHGGDPQAGRVAQVVGGSSVRAAICPLRRGGGISRGGPAATVTAIMTALEAVAAGAGCHCGRTRVVLVRAVPGEGFDGPAEVMAGRAPDR